jgi:hypothetical protein
MNKIAAEEIKKIRARRRGKKPKRSTDGKQTTL